MRGAVVRLLASTLLASTGLAMAPTIVAAQPMDAEPALEERIPDSAVANPEAWVGQAPAAEATPTQQGTPEAGELDPASPLAPLPDIELAWPDDAAVPEIEPLAPEPDIQLAEDQAEAELAKLGVAPGGEAPRLADADVRNIGQGVELAFPAEANFPDGDAVEDRFAALSTLRQLRDDDDNLAQLARRARADRDLLLRTMRVYGYYDAEVFQTLGGLEPGEAGAADETATEPSQVTVRFDVIPGPQYLYGAIGLGALEEVGADYAKLRASFDISTGEPVNADAIIQERTDLTVELGETGYAFATVGEPDLLIDHARREGDLTVPVAPGGKYAFGAVISALPKFLSSKHLATIARFDPGDIYQKSKVDDLRRAILATGLVSTVSVTPRETEAPQPGDPGAVALDVGLTKAPLRTIAGLAGFSSGEGLRVEASWEHRNFFPPEGLIRVRGVAGTREQLAGVTFRRNNFTGRDKVLSVDLYAQTVDRDAFDARTVSLLAQFERASTIIYQKRWTYAAGFEVLATAEREGAVNGVRPPRQTFFIGALPGRIGFDASDSLLDPARGFRLGLRLSPELSVQGGARSTYLKAQLDASYYQPVSERIVVAARARLGTIAGAEIASIAPSRRFYAGGGGSVRGYGYQQIGPRDDAGDPSGGRSLSELSLEARIRTGLFGGAVAFVPFVDAGSVDETSTPSLSDLRFGAGVGLRYYTNFGPLRIDVGTPLNPRKGDSRIGVYVALGQAF
ncbi:MAG: BamA/TamA family outer membrane protein [Novosphingobium sp.]